MGVGNDRNTIRGRSSHRVHVQLVFDDQHPRHRLDLFMQSMIALLRNHIMNGKCVLVSNGWLKVFHLSWDYEAFRFRRRRRYHTRPASEMGQAIAASV